MPFKQLIDDNRMRVVFSKPYFEEVSVELLGDFNGWRRGSTPLALTDDGAWLATLDLQTNGAYRYVYLVNNYIWHSDPEAEDFVEGPYGEEASMLMTTIDQNLPHFFEKVEANRAGRETAVYKKVLLPFESWYLLGSVFGAGLEKAQQSMGELVLLQMNRKDSTDEGCLGQENIFSMLRGLQTQLQHLPVKVSLDTAVGLGAKPIADYATQHDIDLIVISEDQIQSEEDDSVVAALQAIDVCPTYVVRPH